MDEDEEVLLTPGWMGSDFLCARPSLLSGLARIVDLGGFFDSYNRSQTAEEADARATFSDWLNAGRDLHGAIVAYKKQQEADQLAIPFGE